ncbi:NAD(P)/FAD-dependent oxidoreductase [Streptomyces sp. NPDC002248]
MPSDHQPPGPGLPPDLPGPPPRHEGTLIVGASQAGLQLAVALRQAGDTSPLLLVGEEPYAPYQRPPLSKEYLAGELAPEALAFRTPAFYAEQGIELLTGERVTSAALSGGRGTAHTATGRTLGFARLALTVGAAPRRLDVPGAGLDGVLTLRDRDDAVRLRERLADARRVVIVGGGFIGLETAAAARVRDKDVTVVEAGPRLMGRAVAPAVSAAYRAAHERRGTRVLLSTAVTGFAEGAPGRVAGVRLGDGRVLPADLVLVGAGAVARTGLAARLGLTCAGGIVVDAAGRTSRPGVWAAGDCTAAPHPQTGEGRVRIESVQNAVAQASAAAASMCGAPPPKAQVPWFWSFQGDLKLQIAGLSAGHDATVVRGDADGERFSVLYYRDGALLAADCVNSPADYMVVRKALGQGLSIPPGVAADVSVPLKRALPAPGTPRTPAAV